MLKFKSFYTIIHFICVILFLCTGENNSGSDVCLLCFPYNCWWKVHRNSCTPSYFFHSKSKQCGESYSFLSASSSKSLPSQPSGAPKDDLPKNSWVPLKLIVGNLMWILWHAVSDVSVCLTTAWRQHFLMLYSALFSVYSWIPFCQTAIA